MESIMFVLGLDNQSLSSAYHNVWQGFFGSGDCACDLKKYGIFLPKKYDFLCYAYNC